MVRSLDQSQWKPGRSLGPPSQGVKPLRTVAFHARKLSNSCLLAPLAQNLLHLNLSQLGFVQTLVCLSVERDESKTSLLLTVAAVYVACYGWLSRFESQKKRIRSRVWTQPTISYTMWSNNH